MGSLSTGHVGLWAGRRSDASPVIETIPAVDLGGGRYQVSGSPAIATGCAADDVVFVDSDGRFVVESRGGNVAVPVYFGALVSAESLGDLRSRFQKLGGRTEWPADRRFAVITVPVTAGFPAIEKTIGGWCELTPQAEWYYGNVYDDDDVPLRCWGS